VGIENIQEHNRALIEGLVSGLKNTPFVLISPPEPPCRSSLVVISHPDRKRNSQLHARLAEKGIDVAVRNNHLRFSLHLFNTVEQVDRAISALNLIE